MNIVEHWSAGRPLASCELESATDAGRRPRKILYVITGLRVGGAEAMLTRLVSAEHRLADEVIIVSLLPAEAYVERLRAAGVQVVEFDFSTPRRAAAHLIDLARLIRAERPEIIQGWMYHGDLAALLALKLSGRRSQTRLIWSIRCSTLDFSRYRRQLRVVVRACTLLSRAPDVITANSTAGMKSHVALGYRPRRSEIVVNGIDVEQFRPDASRRSAVRRDLGIGDDSVVVAHVARVTPMKDHASFLQAMAHIPDVRALLIGTDTEELPDMPNVVRLGRRDDIPALLPAADFVVSSSAFGEGFSNAIAEGMACGLPAIATAVGDAAEIIGDTGVIVPPRDPRALAAAIAALAAEAPAVRAARSARARARIAEHYRLDRAVRQFAAFYSKLVAPARL
jgi:glycosyltransferase involved in cell wall biosynthesis